MGKLKTHYAVGEKSRRIVLACGWLIKKRDGLQWTEDVNSVTCQLCYRSEAAAEGRALAQAEAVMDDAAFIAHIATLGAPAVDFHFGDAVYLHIQFAKEPDKGYVTNLPTYYPWGQYYPGACQYYPAAWGMPGHKNALSKDWQALAKHIRRGLLNISSVGPGERRELRRLLLDARDTAEIPGIAGCPNLYRPPRDCRRTYGITRYKARVMLAEQGGRCKICRRIVPADKWCIDHVDTATGPVVRGILCNPCNGGRLGGNGDTPAGVLRKLKADPENADLQATYAYLQQSEVEVTRRNNGSYPHKRGAVTAQRAYRGEHPNIRRRRGERLQIKDGITTVYRVKQVWQAAA